MLALEYIHTKNIIHRDIKPENIVFDYEGYAYITDFGISRVQRVGNNTDTSGTPGYMSPEVMFRQDHTNVSDYYAVGIMMYEFVVGTRPFKGKDRQGIRDALKESQIKLRPSDTPLAVSPNYIDLVNKLIQREAKNRIGFHGGAEEIKQHSFFDDFDWEELEEMRAVPPFRPVVPKNIYDYVSYASKPDEIPNPKFTEKDLKVKEIQDIFAGYEKSWGSHEVGTYSNGEYTMEKSKQPSVQPSAPTPHHKKKIMPATKESIPQAKFKKFHLKEGSNGAVLSPTNANGGMRGRINSGAGLGSSPSLDQERDKHLKQSYQAEHMSVQGSVNNNNLTGSIITRDAAKRRVSPAQQRRLVDSDIYDESPGQVKSKPPKPDAYGRTIHMSMSIQAIEEDEEVGVQDYNDNQDSQKVGKSILKSKSTNKQRSIVNDEERVQIPQATATLVQKHDSFQPDDSDYISKGQTFNSAISNRKPPSMGLSKSNAPVDSESQERDSNIYRPSRPRGDKNPPQAKRNRAIVEKMRI